MRGSGVVLWPHVRGRNSALKSGHQQSANVPNTTPSTTLPCPERTGAPRHSGENEKYRFNALAMASATSASAMISPGSPSQAPAEKPGAPPINILPSKLSQGYSCVHPVLLLTLCAVRFEKLVANPVQELLRDLPWLALLQISYVMLCLPPAGSTQAAETVSDGDEKKKAAPRSPGSPSVTLRPGKPGYRRKHQSGKLDWAGALAKLMVLPSISHFNSIAYPLP